MQPVAQAYYQTTYRGRVLVSLMPYRTALAGKRIWRYRWVEHHNGQAIPYLPTRQAGYHVATAMLNPLFDSVACMVEAREHFQRLPALGDQSDG